MALAGDPPAAGPAVTSFVLNVGGPLSLALPLPTRSMNGAVPAGAYPFSVAAVNACGQGPATAPQTVTVP